MILVAGLGNPGPRYAGTRHNVGFLVVDRLADRQGIRLKAKNHQGLFGVGRIDGREVALLLPQTFMNLSGASVGSAYRSLGLHPGDLIVIHDDIDLPFGALRIKVGGGHGGHNGLRSLCSVLPDPGFVRLRVGVGRPPAGGDVSAHVLNAFSAEERSRLPELVDHAVEALTTILSDGPRTAMNIFNNRELFNIDETKQGVKGD